MIAILLYLIGLIASVVTVVLVAGFDGPTIYNSLYGAYQSGLDHVLPALATATAGLGWALWPFLGGLLLMGFARIMMLLGSISRALKGPA